MPQTIESIDVSEVAQAPKQGEFVSFPDSPFGLFMPYPPAGDQPGAIDKLVAGIRDGEVFQTLLNTSLTPEVVDHLITASLEVIESAGAESRARLVAAILQDCEAIEPGVRVALAIAFASKGLDSAEVKVVDRIAAAGGMKPARVAQLTAEIRAMADPDPVSVRESISTRHP